MSKLYIETHGCQMNEYDSSRMGQLLSDSHDLQLTDDPAEADVILLNTCSIREKAQEKVFHQLGRWKNLKKDRPELIIGVGGCVASQEGEGIAKRAPFVDLVFGPQTLHRLPRTRQGEGRPAPRQALAGFQAGRGRASLGGGDRADQRRGDAPEKGETADQGRDRGICDESGFTHPGGPCLADGRAAGSGALPAEPEGVSEHRL